MSKKHTSPGIAAFLPAWFWFICVMVLICMPGDDLPSLSDWFHRFYIDKWVHIFLFGVLTFLFMFPYGMVDMEGRKKKTTFAYIATGVCAWGLATEFIQKYLVTGRSFDLTDWAADSLGISLAWVFAAIFFRKKSIY